MSGVQLVAKIITYELAAVTCLFVVMYAAVSRGAWARSEMGRQLMADRVVLAIVFLMLTAANLWPWLALRLWYQWAYVCVVGSISLVIVWQISILIRLNRRGKDETRNDQ